MADRYRIIIFNRSIYKEIEIVSDMQQFKIGTQKDCDQRLRKDQFFGEIALCFVNIGGSWSVNCSDNLYLDIGDLRKMLALQLTHGMKFKVKYQDSGNEALNVEFVIDFDKKRRKYERLIDISPMSIVKIGSAATNHVIIKSSYVEDELIELQRTSAGYEIKIFQSKYGVWINGAKAGDKDLVKFGDFFAVSDFAFFIKDGQLWTEIREGLQVNGLKVCDYPERNNYPKFNKNSRVKTVVCNEKIEILDPPARPQKPKNNIFLKLLPSLGMMIAAGVMAAYGGTMIIMSAISAIMAIFTTIASFKEGKKDYETSLAERQKKYTTYIQNKKTEIQKCREQERSELEEIYVSQEVNEERICEFSQNLFDRAPGDTDFLHVRIGNGNIKSVREVNYKKQEKLEIEDDLQLIPERICGEYKDVRNAPIVCNFRAHNVIGVTGKIADRFEMLKNLVIDIIARQHFSDVKMVFVANEEHRDYVHWLRMLPHVRNDETGMRDIVTEDESKNVVFEYLYKEMSARAQKKAFNTNIVVFFFDEYGFKSHPISKFVNRAKDLGVTFVFFGDEISDIPQGCGSIILIQDEHKAVLINTANKAETVGVTYSPISTERAQHIVQLMAPVYTEELSLEGTLTKNISLFELLNVLTVDDIDLRGKWASAQVEKSMAAPLGVSKTGTVSLDLHDRAHGPHGLVAGTTGSGKSEILQTYVLAMATMYHPYEVGFVIIDFKGGGMANQFKDLPHLMGAITNIDGREINRSLKSIRAELQKRQRMFADADVNHIDKYIRKYKAGEVDVPMPHLIIIVDEFAELKAEQPEFMKELISAARIGRSLGVHLILATQKPSGQVNEQIWSNSRFKLCLKVQSQEDSNEVLKSPLAAEIKEPGRAYLQVGNDEIFELFQSAYSGAPEMTDDSNMKEFSIYSFSESGKKVPVFVQKKNKSQETGRTQLEAVVRYIDQYCKDENLVKLPNICLPALEKNIDFVVDEKNINEGIIADIGVYDDPENQRQGTFTIDVGANNLMIIGSAQTGKTNALQAIVRSVSTKYSPKDVIFYIIDFASMALKNLEKLNHVGGVVCPSEDEKLKNLFKLIRTEITSRKEKLISVGVSSFAAYREAGMYDLPHIVLMIDNLTALKELYLRDDDELLNVCREGLSVGISVIISNSHTAGIGYKYLSNFAEKMAFFCNDSGEYNALFDHCREKIDNIQGRCLVEMDKRRLECQTYIAFVGEKEIDRVREMQKYIAQTNNRYKNAYADKIPLIPDVLTSGYMFEQFGNLMHRRFNVVSGLDYETVSSCVIDFATLGMLAIAGKEKSGKHNWIKYAVETINRMYPGNSKLYVIDGVAKKLSALKSVDNLKSYSMLADDAVVAVKEIEQELRKRYESIAAGNDEILDETELMVLIIDNLDALTAICNDKEALEAYKNIMGRYKNMGAAILAVVENANIPYSAPEILKNIRDQKNIMFFDDLQNMKMFDVPLAVSRRFKKPVSKGDAYYIKDNECAKLKTPVMGR